MRKLVLSQQRSIISAIRVFLIDLVGLGRPAGLLRIADPSDSPLYIEYDLTHKMAHYLDIHLLIPIMEWLESTDVCPNTVLWSIRSLFVDVRQEGYRCCQIGVIGANKDGRLHHRGVQGRQRDRRGSSGYASSITLTGVEMMERRQSILDQFKVIEENEFINYLTNQSDRVNELMDSNNYTMAALKDEGVCFQRMG